MKARSATPRFRMNRLVVLCTCPLRRSTASTRLLPTVPTTKMAEKSRGMITDSGRVLSPRGIADLFILRRGLVLGRGSDRRTPAYLPTAAKRTVLEWLVQGVLRHKLSEAKRAPVPPEVSTTLDLASEAAIRPWTVCTRQHLRAGSLRGQTGRRAAPARERTHLRAPRTDGTGAARPDVRHRLATRGAQHPHMAVRGLLNPVHDPDWVTGLLRPSRAAQGSQSPPSASAPSGRHLRSRRLVAAPQASTPPGPIRAKHPSAQPP
ncbi:hypothetical protein NDU88_008531 [Pleurodeles waltl]|uniref:Uncharacterized protein n=1 Tax=Pleurodeles waltl TaxID=8319 RepID=A0AAV7PWW8_PLEWA|nr:hypothetical protein NDU88_008531 [Pleurodeles waltl]